jgi:hypothetical protein
MLIRAIVTLIVVLLVSCDQKPAAPSAPAEESSNETWVERSERICGKGYLHLSAHGFAGFKSDQMICVPYKLADQ